MIYVAKLRFSQLFRTENMFVFLQLNWAVLGFISRKVTLSLFLSLNYAVFNLIITITNSSILIGAFAT